MTSSRRAIPEYWLIALLLGAFLVVALFAEQAGQAVVTSEAASSLNANPSGCKALYALLETIPYRVRRLTSTWNALRPDDGMIVIVEKFDKERQPTEKEVDSLRQWTQAGGTVLYFLSNPPRPLEPKDSLAGDIAVVSADAEPDEVTPSSKTSAYTRNVGSIAIASPVRLKPAPNAPYETLFSDARGIIAAHKPLGKGHVVLVADTSIVSNKGIKAADNVVFLANVAQATVGGRERSIQFDEYHHGVGFDSAGEAQQTWISTLPRPIKLAAWPFILLLLLCLVNGNRRFGISRSLPLPVYRASSEYVHSLARWFQRAAASDIVIQTLYQDFRSALLRHLDAPPDVDTPELIRRAAQRFPARANELSQLLYRCDEISSGQRIPPQEMLLLVRQLDQFKYLLDLNSP